MNRASFYESFVQFIIVPYLDANRCIFIKDVENKLLLDSMSDILEKKLSEHDNNKHTNFREEGRFLLEDKVKLLNQAKKEVIQIGIASNSFARYFVQSSSNEFKEPVKKLLQRGVNFHILVLDPKCSLAKEYANDRGEVELISKIGDSLTIFRNLIQEFNSAGYAGKFKISTYSHFPYCYVMMIDPDEPEGCALISNYLHGVKRADIPTLTLYRSANQLMFDKYSDSVKKILIDSIEIT
jgi:sugar-specific transcriptional regulator TrmB